MGASAQANRINVSKIVYAPILTDTATEFTHGPIKTLGAAMQVQLTPSLASGVLYGNGAKTEDMAMLTGVELLVDVNKVYIEARAEIMGNKYVNGVLTENKSDQAIPIAVGFEVEETNGHKELMWLYKGKAKPFANTVKQSEDNITFSTDTINFGFVPRALDGDIRAFGDTANADFTTAMANVFLDSVPGNTNTITGTVVTPTATPAAGTVASGTTVTLATTTAGAIIYYTTDGSTPTTGSTQYTTPIVITTATTIKAIAYKAGMNTSTVLTAAYTITP